MIRSKHKYNAYRTDGRSSKLETSVYQQLKKMEEDGAISDLREQDCCQLCEALKCKIDFSATNVKTGEREYHEAKGMDTDRWNIVKAHWRRYGTGKLYIWKGSYTKPRIVEVIEGGRA